MWGGSRRVRWPQSWGHRREGTFHGGSGDAMTLTASSPEDWMQLVRPRPTLVSGATFELCLARTVWIMIPTCAGKVNSYSLLRTTLKATVYLHPSWLGLVLELGLRPMHYRCHAMCRFVKSSQLPWMSECTGNYVPQHKS